MSEIPHTGSVDGVAGDLPRFLFQFALDYLPVTAHIQLQAGIQRGYISRVGNVHPQFIGLIRNYVVGVKHLYLERRRPLDLHVYNRAPIEGNRLIIGNARPGDQPAEVYTHPAHADLVASDDKFLLHLSGHDAVSGQDAAEGYHPVHRQYIREPAIRKIQRGGNIGKGENTRGVHQEQPATVKLFQTLNASFNDKNAGNRRWKVSAPQISQSQEGVCCCGYRPQNCRPGVTEYFHTP